MTEEDIDRVYADLLLEERRTSEKHRLAIQHRDELARRIMVLCERPEGLTVDDNGRVCSTFRPGAESFPTVDELISAVKTATELTTALDSIKRKLSRFS